MFLLIVKEIIMYNYVHTIAGSATVKCMQLTYLFIVVDYRYTRYVYLKPLLYFENFYGFKMYLVK